VDRPAWQAACEEYAARKASPPSPAIEGPRAGPRCRPGETKPRTSSRPKAEFRECGHWFPVSGKGLLPHDRSGKAFQAGGIKSKRCPGSNSQPK
jgi:hypothetical protein